MRERLLPAGAVLLFALSVWATAVIGWELWQRRDDAPAPPVAVAGTDGAREAQVARVLAPNRLELASGELVTLAALLVPGEGERFFEEGRQASRALVEGSRVRLDGPAEAAFVYREDGSLLQELLLSGGYARLDPEATGDPRLGQLRQIENEARAQNLGVWTQGGLRPPGADLTPSPEPIACEPALVPGDTIGPERAVERIGDTLNVVFFPLRAVSANGDVTLLAGLTDDEFGLVIPATLAPAFEEPQIRLLNRCLVARGQLRTGPGGAPRILLFAPEDLLVLN